MTIKPILFSGPMVKALLDGRKTQTRRILKNQPVLRGAIWHQEKQAHRFAVGDLLYVRETWAHDAPDVETAKRSFEDVMRGGGGSTYGPYYRVCETTLGDIDTLKWRPAIHMPRWASRVTLQVTDVRVQQLQDIGESDARAEGIFKLANGMWRWAEPDSADPKQTGFHTARGAYDDLWGQINGPESWPSNPWVVALSFLCIKANVDDLCKQEVAA